MLCLYLDCETKIVHLQFYSYLCVWTKQKSPNTTLKLMDVCIPLVQLCHLVMVIPKWIQMVLSQVLVVCLTQQWKLDSVKVDSRNLEWLKGRSGENWRFAPTKLKYAGLTTLYVFVYWWLSVPKGRCDKYPREMVSAPGVTCTQEMVSALTGQILIEFAI